MKNSSDGANEPNYSAHFCFEMTDLVGQQSPYLHMFQLIGCL